VTAALFDKSLFNECEEGIIDEGTHQNTECHKSSKCRRSLVFVKGILWLLPIPLRTSSSYVPQRMGVSLPKTMTNALRGTIAAARHGRKYI